MHLKATILALAMVAGATAPAAAWTMIAQRNVTDRAETDEIVLPGNHRFAHLRVCVLRNPVHFIDLDVWFRNGEHQDLKVASRINPGECTRAIDFNGGVRDLDRVKLRYEETSRRRARA
ncbi:MAG TPA: hypothetical protein VG735_08735, partial [Caulobacterales bacterium]|nr:hypothetical protein [Caulobacterales bacterium]